MDLSTWVLVLMPLIYLSIINDALHKLYHGFNMRVILRKLSETTLLISAYPTLLKKCNPTNT